MYNKAGDEVYLAEATVEQVEGYAIFKVGLDEEDAGKLRRQKICGRNLLKLAKLPEAEIETKLLAAPYLLTGGAALNLAEAISAFASPTTGVYLQAENLSKLFHRRVCCLQGFQFAELF